MDTSFSSLRELLFKPVQDEAWNESFCSLIQEVCTEREEEYQTLWIPYCVSHAHLLTKPIKTVTSLPELRRWARYAPFACFFLDFIFQRMTAEEYKRVAQSEDFRKVHSLRLGGNCIAFDVLEAILHTPTLTGLRHLLLSHGQLIGSDCHYFLGEHALSHLERLDLSGNMIDDEGCKTLAQSSCLDSLRTLSLTSNRFCSKGVQWLTQSPYLHNLRSLHVGSNAIGLEGCQALAETGLFFQLQELVLSNCDIGEEECKALARSNSLHSLQKIDLCGNKLNDAACKQLARASFVSHLQEIHLSGNQIGEEGRSVLSMIPNVIIDDDIEKNST